MSHQFDKRTWRRFGLRTLMLATFVAAVVLAWCGRQIRVGRQHQRIALELNSLSQSGCYIDFTHTENVVVRIFPNGGLNTTRRSTLHPLVEKLGLASYARRIAGVTVSLREPQNLERALVLIRELDRLDVLSFAGSAVDEEQLQDLLRSTKVNKLHLAGIGLPRERIPWLSTTELTWLCVAHTEFSNSAIDDLPLSLTYFDAADSRINDEGLNKLVRLRNLKTLRLVHTSTTKEAIESLRTNMPSCEIRWLPRPAANNRNS